MNAKAVNTLTFAVIAFGVIVAALPAFAVSGSKKNLATPVLAAIPEIPKSTFNPAGRNPFVFMEKPVTPIDINSSGSISDDQLRTLKETLSYKGYNVKGEQSWALINERQFFLNVPTFLDPSKTDCKVAAEVIDEKHVVLRLLDNTKRTIEILYRPAQGNK